MLTKTLLVVINSNNSVPTGFGSFAAVAVSAQSRVPHNWRHPVITVPQDISSSRTVASKDASVDYRMSFWTAPDHSLQSKCSFPNTYITQHNSMLTPFRCVLPAECPLLAYDSGSLNTLTWEPQSWWDSKRVVPYSMFGGEIMNGQQQGEQQPTITTSSYFLREPPPKRCSDPLKNFQTCGSACPGSPSFFKISYSHLCCYLVSCGSKNDFVDCPTNCVPGYVISQIFVLYS
jgi:hypothetical protein